MNKPQDCLANLSSDGKRRIQEVVGNIYYYETSYEIYNLTHQKIYAHSKTDPVL